MRAITEALRTAGVATILVVDDRASCLELLRVLVQEAGHAAVEASDGLAALALARKWHPDAMLLDIDLGVGGPGGLEVTRQLKSDPATADIVIIGVSALAYPEDEQRAMEAGCDAYVTKPFDCVALRGLLEDALEVAAHHRLLRR